MSSAAATDAMIVLTTIGADADAVWLARTLVEERLAACVNVLPVMTSIYRWDDEIQEDPEQQLLIKTSAAHLTALEARLAELHPYDVPEFLVIPVARGSESYLSWLTQNVGT